MKPRSTTARRRRALALAAVVALCAGLASLFTGALGPLEDNSVDARFGMRHTERPTEVAVVAVDDVTFSDFEQRWPLRRTRYVQVVRNLKRAGAKQVVFDIQFTEKSPRLSDDLALYDAIGEFGGAVLATSESDVQGRTRVLGGDDALKAIDSRAAAANLPDARGGVVRRIAPRIGRLTTLASAAAARAGHPVDPTRFEPGGSWIDFRGGPGTVPTYSLSDVYHGRIDPARLRGRIVVIGASSPTVQDVHPTSTTRGGSLMSGPEIQANAIWTVLHGLPLRTAPRWLDLLAIVLLGVAIPLVAARFGVLAAMGALPVLLAAFAVAAQLAFSAGTVLTVVPPFVALVVGGLSAVVASHLGESRERRRVAELNELLDAKVRERTRELADTHLEMIHRLGVAVESRDEETGAHIERMSALCHGLGLAAGLDAEKAEELRQASVMHDVGKVGIPDSILHKPGRLDPEERAVMETHAAIGAEILAGSRIPIIRTAEVVARTHHERWDGTGYPARLVGEAIPLPGRIAAICDVYDALTSERPYKRAWTVADALEEIHAQRGRQFDPRLVDLFLEMMARRADEIEAIAPVEAVAG